MSRTRIKVCGLTRAEDVAVAVEAGADACGFIFAESPRRVSVDEAFDLVRHVPGSVTRIGVFVDPDFGEARQIARALDLGAAQFCGSESPLDCSGFCVPVVKTIAVGTELVNGVAEPYRGTVAALLLDTYDSQKAGGTSRTFSWRAVGELPGWAPVFVAGGLTPDNVGDVIRILRPYAVDVSSGVESAPGIKDHALIRAFCEAVRAADEEVYR